MFGDCAGYGESPEKQVTMIAQKVVDAKQPEQQGGRLITATNTRAFALRATLANHLASLFRLRLRAEAEVESGSAIAFRVSS